MSKHESIEEAPLMDRRDLELLLADADPEPGISIYIDTLPQTDAKDKNRIRYKDQIKAARDALEARGCDKRLRAALLERLEQVGESEDFWLYQQHGLAVFVSEQRTLVRKLMDNPGNLAVVAERYYLRPALQILRGEMRHHILCVSVGDVALYASNGRTISRVDLHPEVPTDMPAAIGEPPRANRPIKKDAGGDARNQIMRYFQQLDAAVHEHHSRPAGRPLLLVALPEHQGLFREVSRNPYLLERGLERDPFDGSSSDELANQTWPEVEDALSKNLDEVVQRFQQEFAHDRGARTLEAIAAAVVAGQVETLLVEEDRRVAGSVDPETGELTLAEEDRPDTDDALDALIAQALRTDSEVLFLPRKSMPTDSGAAATFRFAA